MFAHEGFALISIFIVFLLGAIAMCIHPLHALKTRLAQRKLASKQEQNPE
ncbi:hypothetical protein G7013_03920 [Pseudomonas viridiflava]|uniref:Uncharacterized protein n=1 Tax=Pseudomonas viridiflava TaxID=33069 RepID=A0A3M5PJ74_PSEVI|nr:MULTISPECIES: hypothetical protein [Pseudomonas syringae group]MBA1228797.1 hypothetical protein [Pseudomonas viridiflava]RMT84123.1 hypothetical protein ALP40_02818 [Pseudomonas viridiflava]